MPSFIYGAISKLPFLSDGTFMGCNLILLLLSISGKAHSGLSCWHGFLPLPPPRALTVSTGVCNHTSSHSNPGGEDVVCLGYKMILCFR